ncbi:MAG: hypothetical protein LBU32_31900 [Clostridiales bacterium]|nr:hypothetical protein [Clostridiales bacterium]
MDSGNVIYLLKKDSPQAIRMIPIAGLSFPAYGTGIGKALLIGHERKALKAVSAGASGADGKHTILTFDALEKQLRECRSDDIAHEYEKSNPHLRCVGAVLRKDSRIVAALSIAVPIFLCDDRRIALRELLLQSKRRLEDLFREVDLDFASRR